ncbi:MAG: winged helix DNA-binding protein, partial [Candidatus Omnitrophota bacterium]
MCGISVGMEKKPYLTPKQEKVLNFIRKRVGERLPPTIREIGEELGFKSTGTVRDYLKVLIQKGLVKRMNNKSRAIELTERASFKIPIIGTITAGKPNLAYEEIQGYVDADDLFLGRLGFDDVFAL